MRVLWVLLLAVWVLGLAVWVSGNNVACEIKERLDTEAKESADLITQYVKTKASNFPVKFYPIERGVTLYREGSHGKWDYATLDRVGTHLEGTGIRISSHESKLSAATERLLGGYVYEVYVWADLSC